MFKRFLFISTGLICLSCGDTDNPSTESKSDLNPPNNLHSLNLADSIELRFNGSNTESDFKGYYVFGTKTPWSELQALIKYPTNAATDEDGNAREWYESTGIPRCTDNDAFFAKFGMGASGVACEGSGVSDSEESSSSDSDDEDETVNEFKSLILQCSDPETALDLSILKGDDYKPGSLQKCSVNKVWDPSLDTPAQVSIEPGQEYTFFTVSVMGSKFDSISWTSNIIAAASSKTTVDSEYVSLNAGEFKKISFDMTALTASVDSTASTCTGNVCTIAKANNQASTVPTLWIGRSSSGYSQRILVSDSQDDSSTLYLRARDSKVTDPEASDATAVTARVPAAWPSEISTADGIVNPVYGQDVLDFKITHDSNSYYGKLVIEDISYADESGTVGNFGTATIKLSVILQTGAGVLHYFN